MHAPSSLVLSLLGDFRLSGVLLLLAGVLVVGFLKLLAQQLSFLHQRSVALVQGVQKVPIVGELFERGGAQKEVEIAGRARTVHVASTGAKAILDLSDADRGFVDLFLSVDHRLLGSLALFLCLVIRVGGVFKIGLKRDKLIANLVGFSLLLGRGNGKCLCGVDRNNHTESGCGAQEYASRDELRH